MHLKFIPSGFQNLESVNSEDRRLLSAQIYCLQELVLFICAVLYSGCDFRFYSRSGALALESLDIGEKRGVAHSQPCNLSAWRGVHKHEAPCDVALAPGIPHRRFSGVVSVGAVHRPSHECGLLTVLAQGTTKLA